jgi:Holliday junction resolvase
LTIRSVQNDSMHIPLGLPSHELTSRRRLGVSAYRRGRCFEYRVQRFFRRNGWFVVRQPRSAFPDLIAVRSGVVLLIECRMDGSLSRKERRKIVSLARHDVGGDAILACRDGTSLVLKRISPQCARRDHILVTEHLLTFFRPTAAQ